MNIQPHLRSLDYSSHVLGVWDIRLRVSECKGMEKRMESAALFSLYGPGPSEGSRPWDLCYLAPRKVPTVFLGLSEIL